MIPTVHLDECPEAPRLFPRHWKKETPVGVVYWKVGDRHEVTQCRINPKRFTDLMAGYFGEDPSACFMFI